MIQNWYFVSKIVLTFCEKKCSSDLEKKMKSEVEGREFAKTIEMTRTIYSNGERSEQFLKHCFFNLFMEISQI